MFFWLLFFLFFCHCSPRWTAPSEMTSRQSLHSLYSFGSCFICGRLCLFFLGFCPCCFVLCVCTIHCRHGTIHAWFLLGVLSDDSLSHCSSRLDPVPVQDEGDPSEERYDIKFDLVGTYIRFYLLPQSHLLGQRMSVGLFLYFWQRFPKFRRKHDHHCPFICSNHGRRAPFPGSWPG